MTANVSIITAVKDGILTVPNAALRFTPSGKGPTAPAKKGPAVWIVQNKKPKRLPVKTGISDGSFTEILSGPLKEGDEVIVMAAGDKKPVNVRGRGFFR
jgi:HlyD family secretion protein